jgi:kynurenine formamidase
MARKLIDLSMPVHNDMIAFPRVVRPSLAMYENWREFAERIGAAKYGVESLTASCLMVTGDHIGTHMDSLRHLRDDAPGPEGIPLDYCYGDGVVLDFRHLPKGAGITVNDMKAALTKVDYTLKPLDIPLIFTGAGAIQDSPAYVTDQCGMTAEATHWMLDQGVKVAGIDAITFDPPVWAMFERKQFWEAHRVMMTREYYHLENMTNFDQLPPHGFQLSLFPIKWVNATAAPVRAVAIIEE